MPRFFCPVPLSAGQHLTLPATSARHVQVLRLQPGRAITLFNGEGGEWDATISRMGRSDVDVTLGGHHATEREPQRCVELALGMPANDRMDWLVEKATELGVHSVQPLHTSHSVLRLNGERAQKKQAHWQSVAIAACEQSGGNRVPVIHPVRDLAEWLSAFSPPGGRNANMLRCVLSLEAGALSLSSVLRNSDSSAPMTILSGPEGGLSSVEDALARDCGFQPCSLGSRVLRAETASLTALVMTLSLATGEM